MGFDVGAIIGNLIMAYLSQPGHERVPGERHSYQAWVLAEAHILWDTFQRCFAQLWRAGVAGAGAGGIYQPRLNVDAPQLLPMAIDARLRALWGQAMGFAGSKMIRRIVGLAHVEDFESIADPDVRAGCEGKVLRLARDLLVNRGDYPDMNRLIDAVKQHA